MKSRILILAVILVIYGCNKGGSSPGGGNNTNGGPSSVTPPGKSVLLFPAQNSVCTTGGTVSSTQTLIQFNWNKTDNTDWYELDIKNLLTNLTTTQKFTSTTASATLLNGTPYAWAIVSRTAKDTTVSTVSDIWRFYVSGPGIVYYAPFPATIVSPFYNQTITAVNNAVNLSWTGADPDNDIAGYDVYFGTSSTALTIYKSGVTDLFLNNVPVVSTKTYYWKIVTKDSRGNLSDSGVYQFMVR